MKAMNASLHLHAGIILAAGASSRMGRAKALLDLPSGKVLAQHQADILMAAGLTDVIVVLGHGMEAIAAKLDDPRIRIAYNPAWERGRISSLQVGLRSSGAADGALVLPVDSAGVKPDTLRRVLDAAGRSPALAIRPTYEGRPGRLLWIAAALFEEILGVEPTPDFRLDDWIADRATPLPVDDPAILHNVNTPDEWARVRDALGESRS